MSEPKAAYGGAAKPEPTLRVTAIQPDLVWENAAANRASFDAKLGRLAPTDLVVLPEMFTTGFTMDATRLAEPEHGPTEAWMVKWAKQLDAVITGSVIVQSGQDYFNRLLWVRPDGHIASYDKRHLFRLAGEHEHFSSGRRRLVASVKGWRVCPLICYDLRFPAWSRRREADDYDLLVYVANWPDRRHHAWQVLLQARAIENQCYLIGVNRVGKDGTGLNHAGGSAILDSLGEAIAQGGSEECVGTATLEYAKLAHLREKLPFHLDADEFELKAL
jgi:predicted amidohydrolase